MPQKPSRAKKPARSARTTTTKTSRTSKTSLRHKRIFGIRLHHMSGFALLAIGIAWGATLLASQPPRHSDAASCTPDTKLVNPCRPWLSAAVDGYNTGGATQYAFFNKRLNNANVLTNPGMGVTLTHKMDFPHVYHTGGQVLFNGNARNALADTSLYSNPGNPILVNWKPGDKWAAVANGAVDSDIVASAQAVKALGSRKIFLTLWHEPENHGDVGPAGITFTPGCKVPDGNRGSAADYVRMWHHVRDVFNQQGVGNVVWFVNYTGYVGNNGWDCLIKPLYPGNEYVDWIMWNPYSDTGKFVESVSRFYNFLNNNSDATYNFKSKPWGLAEHGSNSTPAQAAAYWDEGKSAIGTNWSQNRFPSIKLYAVFDTSVNGGINGGLRVGYDISGNIDVNEQTAFNRFGQNLLSFGSSTSTPAPNPNPTPAPTKDTIPPTIALTAPAANATLKGTVTVQGTASDNVGVSSVTLRVDDKWIATSEAAPYSFSLDTKKYPDGKHAIVLRAWDKAGNMGQSAIITVNIANTRSTSDDTRTPPTNGGTTVIDANAPSKKPILVTGTVAIAPTTPGNSIQVWVDGKKMPANTIDTRRLTDGTHEIVISENGKKTTKTIRVDNTLPVAAFNHVRAYAVPYSVTFGTVLAALVAWVARPYIFGITSWRERQLIKAQRRIK